MASDIHPLAVCPSLRGQEGVNVWMWCGRITSFWLHRHWIWQGGWQGERERDRKREWEIKKRGGTEIESLTEGSRDRIMKSLNELNCSANSMSQPILLTATTKNRKRSREQKNREWGEITGTGKAFILASCWCLDVQLFLKYKNSRKSVSVDTQRNATKKEVDPVEGSREKKTDINWVRMGGKRVTRNRQVEFREWKQSVYEHYVSRDKRWKSFRSPSFYSGSIPPPPLSLSLSLLLECSNWLFLCHQFHKTFPCQFYCRMDVYVCWHMTGKIWICAVPSHKFRHTN